MNRVGFGCALILGVEVRLAFLDLWRLWFSVGIFDKSLSSIRSLSRRMTVNCTCNNCIVMCVALPRTYCQASSWFPQQTMRHLQVNVLNCFSINVNMCSNPCHTLPLEPEIHWVTPWRSRGGSPWGISWGDPPGRSPSGISKGDPLGGTVLGSPFPRGAGWAEPSGKSQGGPGGRSPPASGGTRGGRSPPLPSPWKALVVS